ncbi:MAG: hypothetical protein HY912_01845 [Desulfomonile tiedjei]|uniref:SGNH hydrolase-type esterase domain-containing protein n=1 Tax=Desulfomonile tiedjei TaxID=2358 RepID=A0A9D6V2Y3_9BACT|nr:hypothetical protein [Desulfomonile tiedjei]
MIPNRERMKRMRLFEFVVPPLAVVLCLALVESLFRALFPQPVAVENNAYYIPDDHMGFRLMPNSEGSYFGHVPVKINEYGLRDDWVSKRKPPQMFRILCLGDSFTMGAGVRQEDSYPKVLEVLLRRQFPNTEVINAGVDGWDTPEYAEYFQREGMSFTPDLVLVGLFVGNDVYVDTTGQHITAVNGRRVFAETATPGIWTRLKVLTYLHFHMARFIIGRQAGEPLPFELESNICDKTIKWLLAVQKSRLTNHELEHDRTVARMGGCLAGLERIATKAADAGAGLLVVIIPDLNQISPMVQSKLLNQKMKLSFDWEMPQRVLRRELESRAILYLDPLHSFEGKECLYNNHTHLTVAGNRLLAQEIYSYLQASAWFRDKRQ